MVVDPYRKWADDRRGRKLHRKCSVKNIPLMAYNHIMHLKPGDLCVVKANFLERTCDFVGIFLRQSSFRYPWHRISFLHNGVEKHLDLLKSEICNCVEVLHEAR